MHRLSLPAYVAVIQPVLAALNQLRLNRGSVWQSGARLRDELRQLVWAKHVVVAVLLMSSMPQTVWYVHIFAQPGEKGRHLPRSSLRLVLYRLWTKV